MSPIGQLTLDQIMSSGRDLAIAGALIKIVWNARGVKAAADAFTARVSKFMDSVEEKLDTLNDNVITVMNNHLPHLDEKLDRIANQGVANDSVPEHDRDRPDPA